MRLQGVIYRRSLAREYGSVPFHFANDALRLDVCRLSCSESPPGSAPGTFPPAMRLISWHSTERGGSGPFTPLKLILIDIARLFSVARKRILRGRGDVALSFASLLRRSFHSSALMRFPMRPTSKLLHIATPQPKQRITNTGWQWMLHTGTRQPKQRIASTCRRVKRNTLSALPGRESSCRATRRVRAM